MEYVTRVAVGLNSTSHLMGQIFGLVAIIWLVLQIGVGGGTVWYGGIIFGSGAKAKAVYKYHR
jgi:hypothetical protein